MADHGIKVAKPGQPVQTANDEDLIMSSAFNLLKTKESGTFAGAGTEAHGLSYVPIFLNFRENAAAGEYNIGRANGGADATNIIFENSRDKRYYIFYQDL
jgi:hypothetical protein|tara:strand:+ start:647 stop:946 length:300 start_codon:yes stop_codon:yes gene_type:complete